MTDAGSDLRLIDAVELNALLQGENEIALLDAREELSFGQAHILYASCMPLSRLELLATAMVPRKSAQIVLCDAGEGLAERAARRLLHFGYQDVSVLDGGIAAWSGIGNIQRRQRPEQGLWRVRRAPLRDAIGVGR